MILHKDIILHHRFISIITLCVISLNCLSQATEISDAVKDKYKISKQSDSDHYIKKLGEANRYYNKADYENAAKAYDEAFTHEKEETRAGHRLFAAASHCMTDNEQGTKDHLFAMIPVTTKTDMKRILVNYKIFDKYYQTVWWKELETQLNERLASLIAHHKNLRIFKKGRNFVYTAIRINTAGDTLANTFITMRPDGTGWGDEAASSQSQVIYDYAYTQQDSTDHIGELEKEVTTEFWIKSDTTGIIENDTEFWIHPIRNNEFFKTEIAPFPTVHYPISHELMQAHKPKILIFSNWGTYSDSRTESEYNYIGEVNKSYAGLDDLLCHKFEAQSFNNFHGISTLEYFFNEDLGFVEMNYVTYDNDTIHFVLDRVVFSSN